MKPGETKRRALRAARNVLADGQGAAKRKPAGRHRRRSARHMRAFADVRRWLEGAERALDGAERKREAEAL